MASERINTLFLCDSYKVTHHLQYPPNTTTIFSYFESRGGKWDKTVFFGLQYILKKYLCGVVITRKMIDEAEVFFTEHFGSNIFNKAGWDYILAKHGGKLPVRIRAVPEGTVVSTRNVLFTVENTDPEAAWLTNYLETLLVQAWYPITVATNSWQCKQLITQYMDRTADSTDKVSYMLHDFGFRGVSSVETAGLGGAAHLVNFLGTDTLAGILIAKEYYGAGMAGSSIPATEHSTMTTWGRDGESDAIKNIMGKVDGLLAVVIDSYDIWNLLDNILGNELKALVEERGEKKGVLVVRPDSGEPTVVVVKVLNILGEKFGFTTNSKGFKLLPSYLRVIQGDGISYDSLGPIMKSIADGGWSLENLTFGSGGALLQRLDRDTQRCAFKCSMAVVGGEEREVFKSPIDDPGKNSKKGRLVLIRDGEGWTTVTESERGDREDQLVTVFENGDLVKEWGWDEVKERAM